MFNNSVFEWVQFSWAKVTDQASIKKFRNKFYNNFHKKIPPKFDLFTDLIFYWTCAPPCWPWFERKFFQTNFRTTWSCCRWTKTTTVDTNNLKKKCIETSLANLFKSVKPKQDKTTKSLGEHWSNKTIFYQ